MAGLYLHIPFCRKACTYCDFHFSTSFNLYDEIVSCLKKELVMKADRMEDKIDTVYFGGGTPSVLMKKDLEGILDRVYQHYNISDQPEITFEANPDDLTKEYLFDLASLGINRLSIGVQSFKEPELQFMNRSHTLAQSYECIRYAQECGIDNISIDLIFGLPKQTMEDWDYNLKELLKLNVPHVSCYSLTIEEKTVLWHQVQKGNVSPIQQGLSREMYLKTISTLNKSGYEHYEISNYAKEGKISKHNSNYWRDKKFMGFGPSAHSYDGLVRGWNVPNNANYIKALNENRIPYEIEELTDVDRYNEYIMTSLRTKWGVRLERLERMGSSYQSYFLTEIKNSMDKGLVLQTENTYTLSDAGKCVADDISASLFIAD